MRTRGEPGPARTEAGPAAVPPATGPAPQLVALARAAGNRATAAVLARQPAPPPPPTLPAQADPALVTAARSALAKAFGDAVAARGVVADLVRDLHAEARADPALAAAADLDARIARLADVRSTAGGYDYVSAGVALGDALAPGTDEGAAFGPAVYVRMAVEAPGTFLAGALGDPTGRAMDVPALAARLDEVLDQLDERAALLQLELDGTVVRLKELRGGVAVAATDAERAALRAQIAQLARRALQLDRLIPKVRKEDESKPRGLVSALADVAPAVDDIRISSTDEAATRKDMGDGLDLLRMRRLEESGDFDSSAAAAAIEPEEAFPEATAHASDEMTSALRTHVRRQEAEVTALRDRVIPKTRTIDGLKKVFEAWYAFVSPAAANPMNEHVLGFLDGLYDVLGHAGTEGGIARAILIHGAEGAIAAALPQAQTQFQYLAPHRESEVRGTAGAPQLRIAERYRSKEGGMDHEGEVASRRDYARQAAAEERDRMAEAQRLQQRGAPADKVAEAAGVDAQTALVLLPPKERRAWSYLIRTEDPISGRKVAEERSMPTDVAEWILAETQRRATLSGPHTTDGIGERAVRGGGGVEAATGTVRDRYVRGAADRPRAPGDPGPRHPNLDEVAGAKARADTDLPQAHLQGQKPQLTVLNALQEYLDGWFAKGESVERIIGVLAIAEREHGLSVQFMKGLTPERLGWAVAKALGIAAALAAAARMGPVGRLFSEGVSRLMHHAGATTVANIITAASWLPAAGGVTALPNARAQAYLAQKIVDAIRALIEDALSKGATATAAAAWRAVAAAPPPTTAGESIRMMMPVLEDPAMRKAFLEVIEGEIAAKRAPPAEMQVYEAMRNALTASLPPGAPHPDRVALDPSSVPPPARTGPGAPAPDPWAGGARPPAPHDPGPRTPGRQRSLAPSRPGAEPGVIYSDLDHMEALATYVRARTDRPDLEVGMWYHRGTDRFVVVQGDEHSVTVAWRDDPDFRGTWQLHSHYHPPDGSGGALMRLPSHEDFAHLASTTPRNPDGSMPAVVSTIHWRNARGEVRQTAFGYERGAGKGWYVKYAHPDTGRIETVYFPGRPWENDARFDRFLQQHGGSGRPRSPVAGGTAAPEGPARLPTASPDAYRNPQLTGEHAGEVRMRDVFDHVDPATKRPVPGPDGFIEVRTLVTDAAGAEIGSVMRRWNPATKTLVLGDSQLAAVPKVIAHGGPGTAPGGTPRDHYFTMRQMKLLGVGEGEVRHVTISEVTNVKTVVQVAQAVRTGRPVDAMLHETSAYHYAQNALVPTGHRIVAARLVSRGKHETVKELIDSHVAGGQGDRTELLAVARAAGLSERSEVETTFDIVLEVAPDVPGTPGGAAPQGGAGHP